MDNSPHSAPLDMPQFNGQNVDHTDLSSYLDFSQMNSPAAGSSKGLLLPQATSSLTSPTSAISQDLNDDSLLMRPSHDYGRFKQQTGLPIQADHIRALGQQHVFPNYNTGIYDAQIWDNMNSQNSMDGGLDTLLEMSNEDFIDPNTLLKQEEAQANIRYFPGMHQQAAQQRQAMMEKQKQREAEQQRQQSRSQSSRRSVSSQPLDQRTEDTISRVMSEIRRSSNIAADHLSPGSNSLLPHVIKAKKDEDDMDEDERLLNSEEGKKLSSKERRQLRNKVSARAFRSRRKEYIGQLEGELAAKANETAEVKRQNQMLMEENARYRALAEKLLSHNAFRPFLEELSRDPDLAESFSKIASSAPQQQEAPMPKDPHPYGSSQFLPPANNSTHVGMTFIPDMPVDLSSLNIGNNNWMSQQPQLIPHDMYQQPSVFAVTELPAGPAEPIDFAALSGKDSDSLIAELEGSEDEKTTYPEIKTAPAKVDSAASIEAVKSQEEPQNNFDENDPTVTLYAINSSTSPAKEADFEPLFGSIAPEKAFARYELVVASEDDDEALSQRLEQMVSRLDSSCRRLESMMSRF
ncbi:hypothetical protein BT63DRAFT_132591 [Microthyrium microscopicum]|uniref:BZIP domain-containing protein n=1 Tax=Microthyrium microscopicum TaxID=703497 RepID=A0A6A6ULH4_9PEZI|nr:hypothetical protein BT63DRAFT_132591 [Microthyrium microscopicum]